MGALKTYKVKEIFYSIQGEGYHSGRPAVFCRFTGCNLWSGKEKDRSNAICNWCDTDFCGIDGENGGTYTAKALVEKILELWVKEYSEPPFVVFTGGEPLLQLDIPLIKAAKEKGIYVAIETNGTRPCPPGIDWVCVSPKQKAKMVLKQGNELKLVHPQPDSEPAVYTDMDFDYFFLQPLDNEFNKQNIRICLDYCLSHPLWKLSLQVHKVLGVK
jgi:7-carboxy-7-deazaguanine synthase (Cx14CxxC type)